jgi:hypothetical protein
MSGIASVVIGRRGSGKTTLSKKLMDARPKGMPVIVYDINDEYKKYYPHPFEDFDIFLVKISSEDVRRTYILIECPCQGKAHREYHPAEFSFIQFRTEKYLSLT